MFSGPDKVDDDIGECTQAAAPPPRPRSSWISEYLVPHEPELRRWLLRKLSCSFDAEDALQDIYVRIAQTASIDHVREPSRYLWTTAVSVVRDRYRRKTGPIELLDEEGHAEFLIDAVSGERAYEARNELDVLVKLLGELPERTRQVLLLRRLEGLSPPDVAGELGISVSAVEKHQRRGQRFLERQWEARQMA